MKGQGRIRKAIVLSCIVIACALMIKTLVPAEENNGKLSEIFLAQPMFAQQGTAFPSDEAGISAYVNVEQTIDLAKAKNAMRGIQAEGINYVIGIIELPGLPEEEFPHMYVSSDGWILAYYSKFAPASRIMHWGKYSGGSISTTTLQDAIEKLFPSIGISAQAASVSYYHFNYPDATNMTVAVDTTEKENGRRKDDSFSYSIPAAVTLYEGSISHFSRGDKSTRLVDESHSKISTTDRDSSYLDCFILKDTYLLRNKSIVIELFLDYAEWQGVAIVFIYR